MPARYRNIKKNCECTISWTKTWECVKCAVIFFCVLVCRSLQMVAGCNVHIVGGCNVLEMIKISFSIRISLDRIFVIHNEMWESSYSFVRWLQNGLLQLMCVKRTTCNEFVNILLNFFWMERVHNFKSFFFNFTI